MEFYITTDYPSERFDEYSNLRNVNDELTPSSLGFVFLREMKLWQQYNYKLIDTSHVDLKAYGYYSFNDKKTSGIFPGLISYFKTKFELSEYDNIKSNHQFKIIKEVVGQENRFVSKISYVYRKNSFIGLTGIIVDNILN